MGNYYFVGTVLPDLQIGSPPEIKFQEFITLLKDNLSHKDYAQTKVLRAFYDVENIRALWKGEELDFRGNLDETELEDMLLRSDHLPPYIKEFLEKYEHKEQRLRYFPAVISGYFKDEAAKASGFLKKFLEFEREFRLVQAAFRAKRMGKDLFTELQFEDPDDGFVAQLLAQKDSKTFEPPEKFEDLKPIFDEYYEAPLELHKALCEYQFGKIEDMLEGPPFSIDRILGYMAQLIMAEKWFELDKEKGTQIIDQIKN